jgi:hypothetical protein
MSTPDYLARPDLLALDIDPETADLLLARSPLTGLGGEPVIEAAHLADLLADLEPGDPLAGPTDD